MNGIKGLVTGWHTVINSIYKTVFGSLGIGGGEGQNGVKIKCPLKIQQSAK